MKAWLLAGLVACAPSLPPEDATLPALPAQYTATASAPSAAAAPWQQLFTDPALAALIRDALAHNTDLREAIARIDIARARITGTSGARLPRVDLVASGGVRKFGAYTMDGAGNAATDIRPGQRVPEHYPEMFVGLQASWEVDLWRRLGSLHGAARARYLASVDGANLVITALVADVATAYYQLLALDRTSELLRQTVTRQEQALALMRVEKQAGRTNELAVQQFAAQLATSRVLLSATAQRTSATENQLAVLLGRIAQPAARDTAALDVAAPALATGVPADVLALRPDIRAAERELTAARFDVRAARAAFYPRLQLTASLGYQAFDPRFLVTTPASLAYSIAAGVVAPLINRQGIAAAFAAASAAQRAALYHYHGVVLRGVADVATALAGLTRTGEIVVEQEARRTALAGTSDIADALFRAGKATYLEVLVAQQSARDAELELVTARRDHQVARVQLYRALGGGWRDVLGAE